WYWASAGKSLTAFLIGLALDEGLIDLKDPTSKYLGENWTSCTSEEENKITIWNQITMTSGLDDTVDDPFCTNPSCLQCLSRPGEGWAYHNAPYTLLDGVISNATGQTLNTFANQKLLSRTGMDGLFLPVDENNVFWSTPRSAARYGLLILNKGVWNGDRILKDTSFFNSMVHSSQSLNPSYGYLWWLNGKESYMLPSSQIVFNGSIVTNAPADMVCAMGLNGQFIDVVPSQNMVWIRMGEAPDGNLVPYTLNDDIWSYINKLDCSTALIDENYHGKISLFPNPLQDLLRCSVCSQFDFEYKFIDMFGQVVKSGKLDESVDVSVLKAGMYMLEVIQGNAVLQTERFIKL
ncbi:MAG: serine hydrolase, partial [Bacteroidetes bacterium]|nr:serine hydrolase [Bacteroidota bacterium]